MAESSRKCYLHIVDDAKSDIKPLTSKRLKTLVDRIKDWKGLYGKQHDIVLILESNGLVEFVDENIDLVRLDVLKSSDLLGKKYVDLLFCISECSYDVPYGFNFFKDCLK